jgi:hypothetical protein
LPTCTLGPHTEIAKVCRRCWYCPECGDGPAPRGFKHLRGDDGGDTICPGTHVKCVVIPPGTPLPVILDTLGIKYQRAWDSSDRAPYPIWVPANDGDVLVVDNDG